MTHDHSEAREVARTLISALCLDSEDPEDPTLEILEAALLRFAASEAERAIQAEREECARVAETLMVDGDSIFRPKIHASHVSIAAALRHRGEKGAAG